jgi:putative FmdB family regulatory protein
MTEDKDRRPITFDYECDTCNYTETLIVEFCDRDEQHCSKCNNKLRRVWSAPNVTRASYVDGRKDKDIEDLKKAAKLEKEMYNKPPSERGEYKKEIHEYKKIRK